MSNPNEKFWNPWHATSNAHLADIAEPPCKLCKFFKPHINYETYQGEIFNEVTICIAEDMFNDFSCFSYKGD